METVPDDHKSAARVSGTPICPACWSPALAGATPADGEGVSEARTGRVCLSVQDVRYGHGRER